MNQSESVNLPLIMKKENLDFIDIFIFFIKLILSFDIDYLFVNKDLRGGSNQENDDEPPESNSSIIYNEFMSALKSAKDFVLKYIMLIVNFILYASVYPTVPFYGVLATIYASMKWFIMKFRNY
jgi:hypothetical protein